MNARFELHIGPIESKVIYSDHGEVMFERVVPVGVAYCEKENLSVTAGSTFLSHVLGLYEQIAFVDRVPEVMYVSAIKHGQWFKQILEGYHYTQFYLPSKRVSVILSPTIADHAGYSKAIPALKF